VIVGQVEPPKVPNAITAAVPAPSQERDTFMCGKCMERVPYMSRGSHARKVHECKVWDIAWTALFDISGWPVCVKCGLAIGTPSGMLQHEKNAGEGHLRRAEPYHWDASDMQTTMGEALARAAGK
jgi:hypothetical protein